MPKRDEPAVFETFTRLIIMLGAATVAGMAFYVYGPPPEKAAATIDHLATRVRELMAETGASAEVASAPETAPPAAPAWPEPEAFAAPGSAAPVAIPGATSGGLDPRLASLTTRLAQLGASGVEIRPWGANGTLHRCCFTAPVEGGSGFQRHFEAVEATAVGAVTAALAELEQTHRSPAKPTFWR